MKLTPFSIKNIYLVVLEKTKVWSMPACIVKKILECTLLDQSPQKLDVFALYLQYILILQEIGHDKTNGTLV